MNKILNLKLLLKINSKKAWIFHGDVFDVTMKSAKWLAKLGAVGYDSLIHINTFVNFVLQKLGRDKISLSKKIKDSVKRAVQFIDNFEETEEVTVKNHFPNLSRQFNVVGMLKEELEFKDHSLKLNYDYIHKNFFVPINEDTYDIQYITKYNPIYPLQACGLIEFDI